MIATVRIYHTYIQTHTRAHVVFADLSVSMLLCYLYCHNIAVWSVLMFSQHVVVHFDSK